MIVDDDESKTRGDQIELGEEIWTHPCRGPEKVQEPVRTEGTSPEKLGNTIQSASDEFTDVLTKEDASPPVVI